MKIYKIAKDISQDEFLRKFPSSLRGLASEALKADSYEDFEKDFLQEIKHGTYWHITDNPNFTIDINRGPRDMSSLSTGESSESKGALMVTSDLENWIPTYPNRQYAALIDLSNVSRSKYRQVSRGFGNEFFLSDPSQARVVKVMTIEQAKRFDKDRSKQLPKSYEKLKEFYDLVKKSFLEFYSK